MRNSPRLEKSILCVEMWPDLLKRVHCAPSIGYSNSPSEILIDSIPIFLSFSVFLPPATHENGQNDMKVFAEATLGNTVDNSRRAGFIKYDRNVLRFQAVWDDRESLYGDIQRFEVGMHACYF